MTYAEYKDLDIVAKLKFWRDLPQGTVLADRGFMDPGWDVHIRELCQEALEAMGEA